MTDKIADGVLLVFAKTPKPGFVKTRLIPELGAVGATDLYKKMLHRTLDIANRSKFTSVELCCFPDVSHPEIEDCKRKYSLDARLQQGADLGERMFYAFEHALNQYKYAVLIGCDCPGMTVSDLNDAYSKLESGHNAVLGPAEDGGYFLIGLRQNSRRLFTGIEWGEADVSSVTRSKMIGLSWRWCELSTRWDVDLPADLVRLQDEMEYN
jgi:hypothetical protein